MRLILLKRIICDIVKKKKKKKLIQECEMSKNK